MKKMHIYPVDKRITKINKDVSYLSIEKYHNIARKIACHHYKYSLFVRRLTKDPDALSFLAEAVIIADGTYDPQYGATLTTWRYKLVCYALSKLNKKRKKQKFNYHDQNENIHHITLSYKHYKNKVDIHSNIDMSIFHQLLNKTNLTKRERECIELRIEKKKMREIGDIMGITKQRVSQLLDGAISKMQLVPYED